MKKLLWPLLPLSVLGLVLIVAWLTKASTPLLSPALQPSESTIPAEATPLPPSPSPAPEAKAQAWPKPPAVKGVYATGWIAGSSKWFPRLVEFIDQTDINSLVVDVKDDTGTLSYVSKVPLVNAIGASEPKIGDPRAMLATLRQHRIFPIARIVVFKDPFLARQKPEWAVKDTAGGLWSDRKGLHWVDPNNQEYWDYIVAIAAEAIDLGFQEIQFDYVRFTSDGEIKRCVYPYSNGQLKQDVIRDFLSYARAKLRPYNVPVSADIFGLTTSVEDDQGIGQLYEKIIANVDVVCPMVYPSHYGPGSFGLGNPNFHPYETVFRAVSDARKRLEKAGNQATALRPWLQDFNLGASYGRAEIQKQIKAVEDAGAKEWIFWNPSCRYQLEKYR